MQEKATYRTGQKQKPTLAQEQVDSPPPNEPTSEVTAEPQQPKRSPEDLPDIELRPGQMFQMDYGFVRGSGYSTKDEDGRRITSLDGMNCYLIIIDKKDASKVGISTKIEGTANRNSEKFSKEK